MRDFTSFEHQDDPHEQGPECDFCGFELDDDEDLVPMYLGEPTPPEPVTLLGRHRKFGPGQIEEQAAMFQALHQEVQESPDFNIEVHNRVHEVTGEALFEAGSGEPTYNPVDHTVRTDKVSVKLVARPNMPTYEPDSMVCPNCAEMFKQS